MKQYEPNPEKLIKLFENMRDKTIQSTSKGIISIEESPKASDTRQRTIEAVTPV